VKHLHIEVEDALYARIKRRCRFKGEMSHLVRRALVEFFCVPPSRRKTVESVQRPSAEPVEGTPTEEGVLCEKS